MDTKRLQQLAGILKESYMGTPYDSSEDMAIDMIKKGITREDADYDESSDSESEDTDAMGGINEAGEGITISVPENTSYMDLAKAVADELKDGYGKHLYKDFLKALVAALKESGEVKEWEEGDEEEDVEEPYENDMDNLDTSLPK